MSRFVPRTRAQVIGAVVLVAYLVRIFWTAPDMGQLFNFTVIGVAEGCVYAIAASGLVLTYATTGVFNFAHGAVGMAAGYAYYSLTVQHGLPTVPALLIVVFVLAPLLGLVLERVMRSFADSSIQTSIVVTIALTVMLIGIAQQAWPPRTAAVLSPLLGDNHILTIWKAHPTYDNVAALVLAVVVALGLRSLLYRSRTGVAMRAVVDNPNLAALNGARPVTIARFSWMLGSVLAAVAGVLLASGTNLDPVNLTFFVAGAYGAAVVGKLKSIPLTFAGAIALGLLRNHAFFALPQGQVWSSFRNALPGVFLFFALLLVPAARLTVGRVVGVRSPNVPGLRRSAVSGVVFICLVVLLSRVVPAEHLTDMTRGLIFATLLLSLVLLTGFSGQISLCQYVFMAIGAWAMGTYFGGNSIWGMLLAGLVAVPLGVLVALPAMRLQGLYLALVTFGFAVVSRDLLLDNPHIFGKHDVAVGRLQLFGIDCSGDKAFFVLAGVVFVVFAIGVLAIRRSPFGRRLAAVRDSKAACATLGLDTRRTQLAVFTVSAFVAGVAGSLYGGLGATAGSIQFDPINNIVLLLFAMVGGVTTVTGALLGGSLFALLPFIASRYPDYQALPFAVIAFGAIALGRQPNGLAGLFFEWAHGGRRNATAGSSSSQPTATLPAGDLPGAGEPIVEGPVHAPA
ncbi:MAG TPA: ABC transporter permease [Acidimicrobiales bacterium]|jgi:branched-chain amino acid transport system permease protein|nr:ABC transporter permease [Acidimicrobiales bacterium]